MKIKEKILLGEIKKEWGYLERLVPSNDNKNYFLKMVDTHRNQKIIFNNKIESELEYVESVFSHAELSPKGDKLAISRNGKIYINGEAKYTYKDTAYQMVWLDNNTLVWKDLDGDGRRGTRVNGELKDGFEHQLIGLGLGRPGAIRVFENNKVYTVYPCGGKSKEKDNNGESLFSYFDEDHAFIHENGECKVGGVSFKEITEVDEEKGIFKKQIIYDGQVGPVFNNGIPQHYVFSRDRKLIGYAGVNQKSIFVDITVGIINLLERAPKWLEKVLILPAFLLLNPVFGPLYLTQNFGKREYVVKGNKMWSKPYKWLTSFFFTSRNELVVMAGDKRKCWVVVDEVEGPKFDRIENIIETKDGISYLAVDKDRIFKVGHQLT